VRQNLPVDVIHATPTSDRRNDSPNSTDHAQ
jgi:hypothetical protein